MSDSIQLIFGGKSYEVTPLTLLKARSWREKLIRSARELSQTLFRETNGHDEDFFQGLGTAYLAFPDKIREMIFLYGEHLPGEEILAAATDDEMIVAFAAVVRAAFPYLHQLSLMAMFDIASRLDEAVLVNSQSVTE